MTPSDLTRLDAQLQRLQLHHIQSHYQALATKAAEQQRSHLDYLAQLVEGEATMRENRSIERRIKNAHFPVLKTLDDFQWSWPKKINRPQIQNLFRLAFIATQTNIVKHWSQIFNNDSTLTSAILDRVLHHADTVIIEGKSYRTKDEIDE